MTVPNSSRLRLVETIVQRSRAKSNVTATHRPTSSISIGTGKPQPATWMVHGRWMSTNTAPNAKSSPIDVVAAQNVPQSRPVPPRTNTPSTGILWKHIGMPVHGPVCQGWHATVVKGLFSSKEAVTKASLRVVAILPQPPSSPSEKNETVKTSVTEQRDGDESRGIAEVFSGSTATGKVSSDQDLEQDAMETMSAIEDTETKISLDNTDTSPSPPARDDDTDAQPQYGYVSKPYGSSGKCKAIFPHGTFAKVGSTVHLYQHKANIARPPPRAPEEKKEFTGDMSWKA